MFSTSLFGTQVEENPDPHQMVKQFYLALSVTTFEAKNDIWEPLFRNSIVPYLRQNDTRLIRLQPCDETVAARAEMAKAGFHPILITVINGQPPQVSDSVKDLALHAFLEVARGNEVARREFGERGCIEHLLPLIRSPVHCAKALECLWMLCFESPENIARILGRFRGRIGQALDEVLELVNSSNVSNIVKTWALALLHNLSRDWYTNRKQGQSAEGGGGSKTYDGAPVRARISKDEHLASILALLQTGPCYPHPSELHQDGKVPEAICAWAAAGVIKTLVMHRGVADRLVEVGVLETLIALFCGDDILEQTQSAKVIFNIVDHFDVYATIRKWFTENHGRIPMAHRKKLLELSVAEVSPYDLHLKERK
uniref:Ataxin-10 domain-containing protein n=1 Tax=Pyramimonas obovata TaxID=1411642 RepID=A0A7S0R9E9_9CHLO|mmetsp:Transcript_28293/g.61991  ORF Transcript_28293/g.61991 Transcript_28293/m.61991 type:complete len:369 (+) Transcript_28293:103-1209(+)